MAQQTTAPRTLGAPPGATAAPPPAPPAPGATRRDALPAVIAGVVLLVAGSVLLVLAWNFAAEEDCIQCQFPYLLSGSLPGLALIILGASVLVINALRRDAAERSAQAERLNAAITELTALVGPRDPYDPSIIGEYRPRPRENGHGAPPQSADASFETGR